jgi:hypothetical protein
MNREQNKQINKNITKFQVQEQYNFRFSSFGVTPSASSPGVDI